MHPRVSNVRGSTMTGADVLIVADDTDRTERELAAGELACPDCRGQLRPLDVLPTTNTPKFLATVLGAEFRTKKRLLEQEINPVSWGASRSGSLRTTAALPDGLPPL